MANLIERGNAVLNLENAAKCWTGADKYSEGIRAGFNLATKVILNLMPAQPEHKKGKWILHREHERIVYDIPPEGPKPPYHRKITPTYKCSECGFISFDYAPNFCEECGADMREENNG